MQKLLKRAEVAEKLGIKAKTLAEWAYLQKGPPFVKLGKSPQSPVRYDEAALNEWMKSNAEAA